ncbi:hypothetical protein E2C01_061681 [Portunus trituberculatus]|uniref:Uncharacterized protein n=1 Tax=Portunus trituberculatus TaxID=210409 RepID=A0A5B7HFX7_PORTR|nr:hypothetical protein [Portunus trituberculatus]
MRHPESLTFPSASVRLTNNNTARHLEQMQDATKRIISNCEDLCLLYARHRKNKGVKEYVELGNDNLLLGFTTITTSTSTTISTINNNNSNTNATITINYNNSNTNTTPPPTPTPPLPLPSPPPPPPTTTTTSSSPAPSPPPTATRVV